MQRLRETFARSPPGTSAGGSLQTPSCERRRQHSAARESMRCADLESGGAPIDELNGTLGLDGGNGGLHILRHDITAVQQAASHVFSFTRIGFDHLVPGLKAGEGHLSDRVLLVVGFVLKSRRQYQWLKRYIEPTAERRGE